MRVDAQKNLNKVAGAALKEPLATEREIAEMAGVGKSTAHTMLGKVGQDVKLDRTSALVTIAERDLEIVAMYQSLALGSMDEISAKLSEGKALSATEINALSQAAEKSQKRQAFIDGDNANSKGGERKLEFVVVNTD